MSIRLIANVAACLGTLVILSCFDARYLPLRAVAQSTPNRNRVGAPPGSLFDPDPFDDPVFRAKRTRALNEQRQKELVADTEKLLQETMELHNEMASKTFTVPTQNQIVRLDRIEKLAKSVREKMTDAIGDSGPVFHDPFVRPYP